jgi:hypothetical protein
MTWISDLQKAAIPVLICGALVRTSSYVQTCPIMNCEWQMPDFCRQYVIPPRISWIDNVYDGFVLMVHIKPPRSIKNHSVLSMDNYLQSHKNSTYVTNNL